MKLEKNMMVGMKNGDVVATYVNINILADAVGFKLATKLKDSVHISNVTTSYKITGNSLLKELCKNYSIDTDVLYSETGEGDIKESYAVIVKSTEILKCEQSVKLCHGLKALRDNL